MIIIDFIESILFIALIIYIVKGIKEAKKIQKEKKQEKDAIVYYKKEYLTKTEILFYQKLMRLEEKYRVIPQINLSTVIAKKNNTNPFQNELFRNIDY